ncbi:hypothetical protein [Algoriphagus sp. A40]|uniref:hypothetical protein n=1 Tax=Algoriphagus sp. A40 TaxID=1945863 RepID=UPI0011158252|nr:hypothetical protein [Algoriphagus sp. A40]
MEISNLEERNLIEEYRPKGPSYTNQVRKGWYSACRVHGTGRPEGPTVAVRSVAFEIGLSDLHLHRP